MGGNGASELAEEVGVSVLIATTSGVCGGSARLTGTRIPVWTLVCMRQSGIPDEGILRSYPALDPANLKAAWEYAGSHAEEIEREIRENEED
jgi:type III restriction enzyme